MFSKSCAIILFVHCFIGYNLARWIGNKQPISADGSKCQYNACPDLPKSMLNVHLVPHSHDDMGWLKTVDQYFWGLNRTIAPGAVQYVLDTVIRELQHDPNKRFIYVETGFFWRWWMIQHDVTRHLVQKLVANGQLEFIMGGWVSNDEAAAHYSAIIDQMSFGLRKLNASFGECGRPKVAWQIDPFGHSREQASIYAQMGFDAVFLGRIHYEDREIRRKSKDMELVWQGSDDLGRSGDIFTGVLYDHYCPPAGFCFDEDCNDDPIVDDRRFAGPASYNVDRKVDDFIAYVKKQAESFQTNNILVPMGCDFTYRNAAKYFLNIDKLIQYVNERQQNGSKINLLYSTPTCYVKALNDARNKLTTKNDDFFPYASDPHAYWTGYFTSRQSLKRSIRSANNKLQVCKQMDTLAMLGPYDQGDLEVLKEAMAVVQHHDAVAGTAQQHVTNDYVLRIAQGVAECQQVLNDAINALQFTSADQYSQSQESTSESRESTDQSLKPKIPKLLNVFCPHTNISICDISQYSNQFTVIAFNGLSKPQTTFIRVPVNRASYVVIEPSSGATIPAQVVKTFQVRQIPAEETHGAPYQLFFQATLPPLGYSTYVVKNSSAYFNSIQETETSSRSRNSVKKGEKTAREVPSLLTVQNDLVELKFDVDTGLLSGFRNLVSNQDIDLKQNFFWYQPMLYDNETQQPSGAYVFRPNGSEPHPVTTEKVKLEKISGQLVQEVRQTFAPWLSQIVRLYQGQPFAEFEYTIGPIPVDLAGKIGKEIITRYSTKIENSGTFFTDSSARQILKRKRNFQPTYPYNDTEPVSGNYYPINSRIFINDAQLQMALLTDRSQGGTSPENGTVELMLHRRLLLDDGYGVVEPLNETEDGQGLVIRGKHWLILSPSTEAAKFHREYAMRMFYEPVLAFSNSTAFENDVDASLQQRFQFAGLAKPLPPNINVLTLEQWNKATVLVRLEHYYQNGEDHQLSAPAKVNLQNLFSTFKVLSAEELVLSANRPAKQLNDRLRWSTQRNPKKGAYFVAETESSAESDPLDVTLNAMEIKTFRCEVQKL